MVGLAGAVVLITRPAAYAEYLNNEVRRLGGRGMVFPTLAIEHCTDGLDEESFTGHDLAIFTSRNAVAAVADYLEQSAFEWPVSLRCAAVGNRTAEAARHTFNVDNVIAPTEYYGASALMAHQSIQNLVGQKVIFFDGGGPRSALLVCMLEDKGCKVVTHAVVYNRVRPPSDAGELQDIFTRDGVNFVVLTSVEAAENLIDMLDRAAVDALKRADMIVYSQRIEQALLQRGFDNTVVADMPSDDSVIELMSRLWEQRASR